MPGHTTVMLSPVFSLSRFKNGEPWKVRCPNRATVPKPGSADLGS